MENEIVQDLRVLGFCLFFEQQIQPSVDSGLVPARITAEHRGAYEVWCQPGAGLAKLSGRLRLELGTTGLPGVGDWVLLKGTPGPGRVAVINRVLDRRTVFKRGAAGRDVRAQVVAANVDIVFAVCGLDADFNIHRIERYLARIWAGGARPAVILNKADLCAVAAVRAAQVADRCAGVPVYVTSALLREGLAEVRASIGEGITAALVGSSGVGKSTLVNQLLGEERMFTRQVRARDSHGRHSTTYRQLVLLQGGGLLLDTPGMRELQLVDEDGLDTVFGDIADISTRCRFHDCRHQTEPGCAVREAVASGRLTADRLEHYLKLQREAQAFERRHDVHLQRRAGRVWGQLHDEAARLRRWRGKP
jgi:ribosome biogenesis GTPase